MQNFKITVLFTVLAVFLTASFFSISDNSVSASSKSETQRNLYIQNCARCHGANGKGETKLGEELAVPDLTSRIIKRKSRSKINSVITNGDGEMPAFGKKLTKAEINSLINYVRKL